MFKITTILLYLISSFLSDAKSPSVEVKYYSRCTMTRLNFYMFFPQPFEGIVYASGYSSEPKCRTYGTGSYKNTPLSFQFNTTTCGIVMTLSEDLKIVFSVPLVVQADKYILQERDYQFEGKCVPIMEPLSKWFNELKNLAYGAENKLTTGSYLWMTITNVWKSRQDQKTEVIVGEKIRLVVKAYVQYGHDMRVVNCTAHDGTETRLLPLTDAYGCVVDKKTISSYYKEPMYPSPEGTNVSGLTYNWPIYLPNALDFDVNPTIIRKIHKSRELIFNYTMEFKAFKFLDSPAVHISCMVQVCFRSCTPVNCKANNTLNPTLNNNISYIQHVFNSIKVLSSNVYDYMDHTVNLPMDRLQVAFTFLLIGLVFFLSALSVLYLITQHSNNCTNCCLEGEGNNDYSTSEI